MIVRYPACFFKEENMYSVIFQDLNYLATCGDNLEDATEMAIECLGFYLSDLDELPKPTKLGNVNPDKLAEELDFEYENVIIKCISVEI